MTINHDPCFSRGRSGFTLIELLVVVAIISVLVALLLPALSSARERARSTVCSNNTRQLLVAQNYYAQDNGVYAGYWYNGAPPISFLGKYFGASVFDIYTPPVGQPVNFPPYVCPSVPAGVRTGGWYEGIVMPYGWNNFLGSYDYGPQASVLFKFRSPDHVARPSEIAGWADTKDWGGVFRPPWSPTWYGVEIDLRHGMNKSFANAAFLDGHCAPVTAKDKNSSPKIYDPNN